MTPEQIRQDQIDEARRREARRAARVRPQPANPERPPKPFVANRMTLAFAKAFGQKRRAEG
jgi:hypothetical protein